MSNISSISGPVDGAKLRVLSLGAGVQSTTMALMAAHGEITPMPDCAIFADTGAEPVQVYEHLEWLMSGNVLPFPVHVVSQGNLYDDLVLGMNSTEHRFASIPFFTRHNGQDGMARRQCTSEYKISPINRKVRELLGGKRGKASVEMWIGISTDEYQRMKRSHVQYIVNRFPLIELRMKRDACLKWMNKNGYQRPPKSACTFCPYRSNESWRLMKVTDPIGWQQALDADAALRQHSSRLDAKLYLHAQRIPLEDVDLSSHAEIGQGDFFNGECEGMCGV